MSRSQSSLVKNERSNANDSDDEASEVKSSAKRSKSSVYRPEEEVKKYEAVFLTFYLNAKLNGNGGASVSLLLENKISDRLILQKEVKEDIPLTVKHILCLMNFLRARQP